MNVLLKNVFYAIILFSVYNSVSFPPFLFIPDTLNLLKTLFTSQSPTLVFISPNTSTLALYHHMYLYTYNYSQKLSLSFTHFSIPGAHKLITLQNSLFKHIPTYIILELHLRINIRSFISTVTPSLEFSLPLPQI